MSYEFDSYFEPEGVLKVLATPEMQEFAGINKQDRAKLSAMKTRVRPELIKKVGELQKKTVEELLRPLSLNEKQIVFAKWPTLSKPESLNHLSMCVYFLTSEKISKSNAELPIVQQIYNFPSLKIGQSGAISPKQMGINSNKMLSEWYTCELFFANIANGSLEENVVLSESQTQALKQLYSEVANKIYHTSLKSIDSSPGGGESGNNELKAMKVSMGKEALSSIQSILAKAQWKQFQKHCRHILAKQYGPLYDVCRGPLIAGTELEQRKETWHRKIAAKGN